MQNLGELAVLTSVFRGRGAAVDDARGHKEWFHMCVQTGTLELILNFNVELPPRLGVAGRVICLWRDHGWHGCMTSAAPSEVRAARGRVDVGIGMHRLMAEAGMFHVRVCSPEHDVEVDLRLVPQTAPLRATSQGFGGGGALHWGVVPALRAYGTLCVPGRRERVEDAPAYHDHNWGRWRWGDNFAWHWGYALPARPAKRDDNDAEVALVYSRLLDRAGLVERDRRLNVWLGPALARVFVGREIVWHSRGILRPTKVLRLPAVLALAAPGEALGAPAEMELVARSGRDALTVTVRCDPHAAAQFLVPDETGLTTTVIDELVTTIDVTGVVGGRRLTAAARGIFEAVHAA